LDGDGNKCNGECYPIYPAQDGHIKQRAGNERILGSKGQFCAAFYHVHQWRHEKEDPIPSRKHYCLDKKECIVATKAKTSSTKWYVQNKKVVAVVKFEDANGKIQYQARYTNCYKKSEQKHAEDFFKEDIENENGALREKVNTNPNGTIAMYLTIQPCNMSTSIEGRPNTPANKTCCKTLKEIFTDGILRQRKIKLCVKATNLCRLSLIKEKDKDDETLRENAVNGIKSLMEIGVKFSGMTQEDWHYLLSLTDELENREDLEVHEGRKDLDASVQSVFDEIYKTCMRLTQDEIDEDEID
jgi:hypothetical protein